MLSVCIPVYNSDISQLLEALVEQQTKSHFQIEIIVIDDASTEYFKKINSTFSDKIKYIENNENKGRARIRNQFLEFASLPFLLFIDGDSALISDTFLEDYNIELQRSNPDVLCGASVYQKDSPDRNHLLRWKYSTFRESKSLEQRLENPNLGFKTNNFVIRKTVFETIKFNEQLLGYGHEDTLFGFELQQKKIKINHIDNPVKNKNLDDNSTFLKKTEEGIQSLLKVLEIIENNPKFIENIKLLKVYYKIQKNGLLKFGLSVAELLFPILKRLLEKGYFVLICFDIYKLVLLNRNLKKR